MLAGTHTRTSSGRAILTAMRCRSRQQCLVASAVLLAARAAVAVSDAAPAQSQQQQQQEHQRRRLAPEQAQGGVYGFEGVAVAPAIANKDVSRLQSLVALCFLRRPRSWRWLQMLISADLCFLRRPCFILRPRSSRWLWYADQNVNFLNYVQILPILCTKCGVLLHEPVLTTGHQCRFSAAPS